MTRVTINETDGTVLGFGKSTPGPGEKIIEAVPDIPKADWNEAYFNAADTARDVQDVLALRKSRAETDAVDEAASTEANKRRLRAIAIEEARLRIEQAAAEDVIADIDAGTITDEAGARGSAKYKIPRGT